MVHHTNHEKEYTCLLKGKKERNVHFCSLFALRNLIKLQDVWHGYVHPCGTARQCTRLSSTWPLQEVAWLLGIAT